MSDSTKAITPELIDALVKVLEPKLEELVETQVKKALPKVGNPPLQKARSYELVEQTKSALADPMKLWVVENDTRRR